MKRLALFFALTLVSLIGFSQEKKFSLSLFENKEFSFIAAEYDNDYFIRIETVDENYQPTYFEIVTLKEIAEFNQSLKEAKVKFDEYKEIAKQNNVKSFTKILDIDFPKVTLIWQISEWYSGPKSKPAAVFFVVDGTCLMSIMKQSASRTNSYIKSEGSLHLMSDQDFETIIELTNPENIKEFISSAKKVEDLFN